jgi:hypothetical protein
MRHGKRFGWLLIALLAAATAGAAEWKDLAVVSFSGWEECQADVALLGQMAQNPDLAKQVGKALSGKFGIEQLEGIDPRRPWGAVVQTDGLRVVPLVFVPVSDPDALLKSLVPLVGEPQRVSDNTWKIGKQTLTGFVRTKEGWAWLGQSEDALVRLPDPIAVLGDLPQRYDLAVRFSPAHLPEALRTLAIDHLHEEARLRPEAELVHRWLEEFFTDVRQATLGWTLDRTNKLAALELTLTPMPGGKAGPRWQKQQELVKSLRGSPESVTSLDLSIAFNGGAKLGNELGLVKLLQQRGLGGKSNGELAAACADALAALLAEASRSKPGEAALRIYGRSPPFALLAAARLSDPSVVEREIDKLSQAAAAEGSFLRVKKDALEHGSLRVHTLEVVGTDDAALARKLLGADGTIYVATSGQHVFVACGEQAVPAIEKSLPGLAAATSVVQFSLRLGSVLSAVSRVSDDQSLAPILTLIGLSLQAGDDRLVFVIDAGSEGARARLEVRESLLRSAALGISLVTAQMLESQRKLEATRPRQNP